MFFYNDYIVFTMQLTDKCFINRRLLNQALFKNARNTADNSCVCLNDDIN